MLPPLAVTRLLWSFRDQKYGWTESWCQNGLKSRDEIVAALQAYLGVRMPLMGNGIWCDYASGRYLNGTSFSIKLTPNQITTTNAVPPPTSTPGGLVGFTPISPADPTPPDRPYSSLMLSVFGPAGQSKKIYLSGCPDDVIIDPFGPIFNGAYQRAFQQYRAVVLQNAFGWIGTQGNGAQRFPLVSIGAGPNAIVAATGGGFGLNSVVQVSGMRGLTGYRGRFMVASVVGNSFGLQGYDPPAPLARPIGYIQQVVYQFIPASLFQGPSENKRSRGKGIALPVGRRKARRS